MSYEITPSGFACPMAFCASPFFDARPEGALPEIIVVHCISLPRGHYGTGCVRGLFTGTLDLGLDESFESLRGLEVSSHFFISRQGAPTQFVGTGERAWHAGVSSFEGRTGCNAFSVGIELEGVDDAPFEDAQYKTLIQIISALKKRYPGIKAVTGHSDIAPGRKTDPGTGFDWARLTACGLKIVHG